MYKQPFNNIVIEVAAACWKPQRRIIHKVHILVQVFVFFQPLQFQLVPVPAPGKSPGMILRLSPTA